MDKRAHLVAIFFSIFFHQPSLFAHSEGSSELSEISVSTEWDLQKTTWILAPGSFVLKNYEELKSDQAQSLDDILNHEPGVRFTGGPRTQSEVPKIRGLDASRILILEDGARQNFQSGHSGRIFSDVTFLESVEVIKGPWSSLYGSGAIGGVISLQRPTARSYLNRSGESWGFEISGDSESANNGFGSRITGFGKSGFFEPLISMRQDQGGDIRLGGGDKLKNSAFRSKDYYASFGFDLGRAHQVSLRAGERESSGLSPLNPNEEGTGAADDTAQTINKKTDIVIDHSWKEGFLIDYHANFYYRRSDVVKVRLSDERNDLQRLETAGFDLWNHFAFIHSDDWQSVLTLGGEFFEDKQVGRRNGGDLNTFPNAKGDQSAVFAQSQLIYKERTKFVPGVRFDQFQFKSLEDGFGGNSGDEVSGKFHVVHEYSENKSFFIGYAEAFNAPRLQDLYINGLHFTSPGPFPPPNFFETNTDLKPERAAGVEVGSKNKWIKGGNVLDLDVTFYANETKNFIFRNVNLNAGTTRLENNPNKSLHYGGEAKARWKKGSYQTVLSYSQSRAMDIKTKEALPDIAGATWVLGVEKSWGASRALLAGMDIEYVEPQKNISSNESLVPSYVDQGVYIGYGLRKGKGGNISARVNNLFDRKYRRSGSSINETGRDIRIQASWLF